MGEPDMIERVARIEMRLRQVLQLIANAPKDWTTIPDDQGDFLGNEQFVGIELIDDAATLLLDWDEEDAAFGKPDAREDGAS